MSSYSKGDALISIVVPVYNTDLYLEKCISSITNQTYKRLQILLIDDGSTDQSGKICDILAEKDDRIKVIHKSNGGLSDARNCGIENSDGEYLAFIDSDDYIAPNYIERLYEVIRERKAEIAICGLYIVEENQKNKPIKQRDGDYNGREIQWKLYAKGAMFYTITWNKMYLKSLFQNIRFPKGRIHEDYATTYKLFWNASKISVIEDCLYYYVMRQGSITHNAELEEKSCRHYIIFMEERIHFYDQCEEYALKARAKKNLFYKTIKLLKISNNAALEKESLYGLYKELIKSSDYSIIAKLGLILTWGKYRILSFFSKVV